jgi:hypothetical protein
MFLRQDDGVAASAVSAPIWGLAAQPARVHAPQAIVAPGSCAVLGCGRRHVDVADAGQSLLDDMTDDQLIQRVMLRRGVAQRKAS